MNAAERLVFAVQSALPDIRRVTPLKGIAANLERAANDADKELTLQRQKMQNYEVVRRNIQHYNRRGR